MKNLAFQELTTAYYFKWNLISAVLITIIGVILNFELGLTEIEARLSKSLLIVGPSILILFTYKLEGRTFARIRDESARIGILFLILMTFNMSFTNDATSYEKAHFIIPALSFIIIYLLAFSVKIYMEPYLLEKENKTGHLSSD